MTSALAEVAIKAGHHLFHQHFVSGHKGIYVHFKAADLFNTQLMDKSHTSYQRLRLRRQDMVVKSIERLKSLFEEHRILERSQKSAEDITYNLTHFPTEKEKLQTLFNTLDNIDAERIDYMEAAEKYAGRPPPNGIYEWSPSLEKSGRTVTYWKLRPSNSKANIPKSPRVRYLKTELNIEDTESDSQTYIQCKMEGARKELRTV